ncbi:unnamed protein product [Parascedosporium putredinis]|uniref:dsRNA binding domain-containing protein n=1 Tax=Parascedosporium putredinis TaxID=1442378 RepID=A0A9P1GZ74_9PEZI|nr:unnamed protein product [Parascedosporium putredinis]CAI7990624.1 unnamed protein product [Parascedosporium putredinis]
MLSIHAALQSSIQTYVEELEKAQQKHTAATGGEQGRDRSFWLEAPHPPKCLPDMVEAYVGAAFVDSGYDYGTVQEFFERHVRPYFEDMTLYDSFANRHPVTYMASRLAREYGCKEWRVLVREDAPDAEEAGAGCVTGTEMAAGVLVHGKVFAAARGARAGVTPRWRRRERRWRLWTRWGGRSLELGSGAIVVWRVAR